MFGLLNLNKPEGWTSRDVVNRVARLCGRKVKVGHAGTLDPLATGVLVVCVGGATRLVPLIHEHLKGYEAEFLLGAKSDSDDTEGEVTPVEIPADLTAESIESLLPEFTGEIQQVPPIYSAVKVNGKRAYKAARHGESFELSPRTVTVSRLSLARFKPPQFTLSIECSTGTYIRSIGRDLARKLGTEAVMSKLTRTYVGTMTIENAIDPDELTRERLPGLLLSPLTMLTHLRSIPVSGEQAHRLQCGQSLPWPDDLQDAPEGETVTITAPGGELFAIAEKVDGRIAPRIVCGGAQSG